MTMAREKAGPTILRDRATADEPATVHPTPNGRWVVTQRRRGRVFAEIVAVRDTREEAAQEAQRINAKLPERQRRPS